ncbi:hypothetical protein [Streptomyces sp. NPDC052535]|uniref:hypothetical protein n=1 Tax=Streptomyces sp. NPDC052535 TaxID=3155531 RepID=UPI0034224FF4
MTAVEQATGSSDSAWKNLTFEARDADRRHVRIEIDLGRVEVEVSGEDATWVHGQRARLDLLLRKSGGHEPGKGKTTWAEGMLVAGVGMAVLALIGHLAAAVDPQEYGDADLANLDPASRLLYARFVAITILTGGVGMWIIRRTQRSLLLVTEELPTGSWWARLSSSDKFAAIAAIAGVVSAIAAVFSGG